MMVSYKNYRKLFEKQDRELKQIYYMIHLGKFNILVPPNELVTKTLQTVAKYISGPSLGTVVEIGNDVTVVQNNPLKLLCPVNEAAQPDVQWLKDNKSLTASDGYEILYNSLLIKDTTEEAKYQITCRVVGLLGAVDLSSEVSITGNVLRKLMIVKMRKRGTIKMSQIFPCC